MMEATRKYSSTWMTRRYTFALVVIALLAITAFASLRMVVVQQESTGAVVNISGRQRMLSQRTTLFVDRMILAETAREYRRFKNELFKTVNLMEKSHNALIKGDAELGLPDEMSETVRKMYFKPGHFVGEPPLDDHMRFFIKALRKILTAEFGSLDPDMPEIRIVLATATGPLLISLDRMVWQYQREGEEVIKVLHRLEVVVLTLTLIFLMLEAFFIFRPMVRQVMAQIAHLSKISDDLNREVLIRTRAEEELTDARNKLEVRVEERTKDLRREIAERKKAEEKLKHMATHDALTGLPTRLVCKDHIAQAAASSRRNKKTAAVLFIDLDGFKDANDRFGHDAGDTLLQGVAERLLSNVREVDTVSRIGGDEFIVVLVDIDSRESAATISKKLIGALSSPFLLPQGDATIGASIGIALCPEDTEDPEQLLQRADEAMYSVKNQGKNNFAFAGDRKQDQACA